MGENKAFLMLEGRTLIDYAINQARSVADDIFIVGPKPLYSAFGRIVPDQHPDCGPLGGIHAALERSRTQLSLVLALDTPFITDEFLKYLIAAAKKTQAIVTVPRVGGRLQPLCAVYRNEFSVIADIAIRQGQLKVDKLFNPETTLVLEEDVLRAAGFDPAIFDNLNSKEDFDRATKQLAKAANPPS
jgi:molybdenum cofactor guanylyltransferase